MQNQGVSRQLFDPPVGGEGESVACLPPDVGSLKHSLPLNAFLCIFTSLLSLHSFQCLISPFSQENKSYWIRAHSGDLISTWPSSKTLFQIRSHSQVLGEDFNTFFGDTSQPTSMSTLNYIYKILFAI